MGLERYPRRGDLAHRLWRMRPFYAPSQIAAIFDKNPNFSSATQHAKPLKDWVWGEFDPLSIQDSNVTNIRDDDGNIINTVVHRPRMENIPVSDAALEESFARILNLTTLSSRNFRVYVVGEYGQVDSQGKWKNTVSSAKRVYELFMRPERDLGAGGSATDIKRVRCEVISERDY
jgi:hypothetical protein